MNLRFIHMTGPFNQLPTYLPRQTRWTLAVPSGPSAGAPPPSSRPCMGPAQSRPALPPPTARTNVSLVVLFSPWQPLSAGKHGGPGLFLPHVGAPPCCMQMHLGDRRRESLRSASSPTLGILNTKPPRRLGAQHPLCSVYDPLVPRLGIFPAAGLFLSLCLVVLSCPSLPSTLAGLLFCQSLSGLLLVQSTH